MAKNKPHDAFFKSLLSDLDRARTFLQRMLPEELSAVLNFETLEHENQSFVRRDLREFFSDALFKVRLLPSSKRIVIVSILLEHKSYPDPGVAVQMLTYLAEGYRAQLERSPKEQKNSEESTREERFSLHPIIPFLYYHGKEDWEFIPLHELFHSDYQTFLSYIPTFDTIYQSLRQLNEDELLRLQEAWLRGILVTQKFSHNPSALIERFTPIFNAINESMGGNFFSQFILYYIQITSIEHQQFRHLWDQLPENENTENMNWVEKILWQGYQKGVKQGFKSGIEEGMERGIDEGLGQKNRQIILTGIQHGFSISALSILTGSTEEEIQQIIAQENLDLK